MPLDVKARVRSKVRWSAVSAASARRTIAHAAQKRLDHRVFCCTIRYCKPGNAMPYTPPSCLRKLSKATVRLVIRLPYFKVRVRAAQETGRLKGANGQSHDSRHPQRHARVQVQLHSCWVLSAHPGREYSITTLNRYQDNNDPCERFVFKFWG